MDSIVSNASDYSIELAWGGKLPSVGDFVWSDSFTPLRTQLDNWLLTGMQQFRSMRSSSWESSFDQAPMWNFIVPAGMLGSSCVLGCISPSCDRIGRRFPFVATYSLPVSTPGWYLSEVMNVVPSLLTQTGVLLFNGIRRQWPRETLATLLSQALINWKEEALLPEVKQTDLSKPHSDSVILDVLAGENKPSSSSTDASVMHDNCFSSLPWSNVTDSLIASLSTSFWWTNGAGGAALKAFTYETHLDGTLMTWLFGRS